jgi:hypothetical protein
MVTSDQILQSDILGMFEARHSRSIKNHNGFLKAGVEALNAAGAVRLMTASIRLMGQSKSMRSIIDATQPEQRRGLA